MSGAARTLVLGWGNPGRGDDGLGPALVGELSKLGLDGVAFDANYHLTVEDSAEIVRHPRVVFVDAARSGDAPFRVRRIRGDTGHLGFSTHGVDPSTVLAIGRDLYGVEPEAWLIGIRGYEFEPFVEGLSAEARANLGEAVEYLREALATGAFEPAPPARRRCREVV